MTAGRSPADPLWSGLLVDEAIALGDAPGAAVAEHVARRRSADAPTLSPPLIPDDHLTAVEQALAGTPDPTGSDPGPLPVAAVITSGAGGLVALGRRRFERLRVVAAVAELRDRDDQVGAARRTVAAADAARDAVGHDIELVVGFAGPARLAEAIEVVEAAGGSGIASLAGSVQDHLRLAAAFVEADLPFIATDVPEIGVARVLAAVAVLIDDGDLPGAIEMLGSPAAVDIVWSWSEADVTRVRRRVRGIGLRNVEATLVELRATGLLSG